MSSPTYSIYIHTPDKILTPTCTYIWGVSICIYMCKPSLAYISTCQLLKKTLDCYFLGINSFI